MALLAFATLSCTACATKRSRPPEQNLEGAAEGRGVEPTVRAEEPKAEHPSVPVPAADWNQELTGLPDSVLVGTDVTPLRDFLSSVTPIPLTGTFHCEQGGATGEVRLEATAKGRTLTREFAEPGTTAQVRRYDGLRSQAGGMRLSGKDLEVIGTKQSILVLEKSSGVDGIPDSLWIEYELTPSKHQQAGDGH